MVEAVKKYLKTPHWRRQHLWRKAIWNAMSHMGLTGAHALPMNRRWIEIHRRKMPRHDLTTQLPAFSAFSISAFSTASILSGVTGPTIL